MTNLKSQKETVEEVPTTSRQSETSRRKQWGCVSKKSGGLNLHLYHLERKRPSRNEIAASFGLSPSSVSKHMTGKVLLMGPALGGARRGRVLNAGMFQVT